MPRTKRKSSIHGGGKSKKIMRGGMESTSKNPVESEDHHANLSISRRENMSTSTGGDTDTGKYNYTIFEGELKKNNIINGLVKVFMKLKEEFYNGKKGKIELDFQEINKLRDFSYENKKNHLLFVRANPKNNNPNDTSGFHKFLIGFTLNSSETKIFYVISSRPYSKKEAKKNKKHSAGNESVQLIHQEFLNKYKGKMIHIYFPQLEHILNESNSEELELDLQNVFNLKSVYKKKKNSEKYVSGFVLPIFTKKTYKEKPEIKVLESFEEGEGDSDLKDLFVKLEEAEPKAAGKDVNTVPNPLYGQDVNTVPNPLYGQGPELSPEGKYAGYTAAFSLRDRATHDEVYSKPWAVTADGVVYDEVPIVPRPLRLRSAKPPPKRTTYASSNNQVDPAAESNDGGTKAVTPIEAVYKIDHTQAIDGRATTIRPTQNPYFVDTREAMPQDKTKYEVTHPPGEGGGRNQGPALYALPSDLAAPEAAPGPTYLGGKAEVTDNRLSEVQAGEERIYEADPRGASGGGQIARCEEKSDGTRDETNAAARKSSNPSVGGGKQPRKQQRRQSRRQQKRQSRKQTRKQQRRQSRKQSRRQPRQSQRKQRRIRTRRNRK